MIARLIAIALCLLILVVVGLALDYYKRPRWNDEDKGSRS